MNFLLSFGSNPKVIHAIRFILVGLLNTGFSYLIYAFFLFIGIGYQLANLLAVVVGILFSFKTQGHLVFGNSNNRLLGRFILSWALIYLCVIFLIGRFMSLGFNAYVAGALVFPFSVVLSYLAQRHFVFRRSSAHKSKADGA